MKLYTFTAQHKPNGPWEDIKLSDGSLMFITLTTNDGSALNTGCRPDFRWIGPATIHTIEVNTGCDLPATLWPCGNTAT